MNQEEIEQIKQYEWDLFCRRYPELTGRNRWRRILSKLLCLFNYHNVQHLLWENGFLQGWIQAKKEL